MLYRGLFLSVLSNICLARRHHVYPDCGRIGLDDAVQLQLQDKVISGHQAAKGNFPWLVAILLEGEPVCTGSLISRTQVLTAAHCLEKRIRATVRELEPVNITVVIGRMNLTYQTVGTEVGVTDFERSDAYSWENNVGDVAVLTLDQNVTINNYTAPICLARNFTEDIGDFGTLAGWGRTMAKNGSSTTISKNNTAGENILLYRHFSDCKFPQIKYANVSSETDFICAGGNMRMPSKGDDGAPLMHVIEGIWYQVGILSFGVQLHSIKNDYTAGFGIFNRVSSYCPWIEALNSSRGNTTCRDVPKFDN